MTDTPLTENDRFISLSPSAGSTTLAYDFELRSEEDLVIIRIRAGAQTTLELTTHYTFPDGVGDESGGTATLGSATLAGDVYWLVGLETIERLSDFAAAQKFQTVKINADLDALVRIAQEARRDIGRAFKTAYGQEGPTVSETLEEGDTLMIGPGNTVVKGPDASDIQEAEGYADAAKEWAFNDEDVPVSEAGGGDGSTTFSSKHYSIKGAASNAQAGLRVGYAAEWANKAPGQLVSADAGGDEVDDYSAKHWASEALAAAMVAAQKFFPVRCIDTAGGDPDTDYEEGDTIDGVTLVQGNLVLRATPLGDPDDGVYVVPASGPASRAPTLDDYDDLPGVFFSVQEGTAYEDTFWRVVSDTGGTLGVTDILITEFSAALGTEFSVGQCRLQLDGTNIKLIPLNGNRIGINGVLKTIPSGGVSLSASGLTPGTLYYVYVYDNAGTLTLEASTTGHVTDTSTGIEIKSGDATRTMVGWAVPDTGPVFVNSTTKQFVRSWFNDAGIRCVGTFTADRSYGTNAWAEINTEIRVEFISRGETLLFSQVGLCFHAAASGKIVATAVGLDGVAPSAGFYVTCSPTVSSGVNYMPVAGMWAHNVSEGKHYATLMAISYDTVSWTWKGGTGGSANTAITVVSTGNAAATVGEDIITVKGVLICDGSGNWSILDDADHTPIGVASVSQNSTGITITFATTGTEVIGSQTSLDETLATGSEVDKIGASVGLSQIGIQLGKIDGSGNTSLVDPANVTGGNIWFEVEMR